MNTCAYVISTIKNNKKVYLAKDDSCGSYWHTRIEKAKKFHSTSDIFEYRISQYILNEVDSIIIQPYWIDFKNI